MKQTEYLTPQELCERYKSRISPRTLANWRSSGEGPRHSKIGGRVLYEKSAVEDWELKRQRQEKK